MEMKDKLQKTNHSKAYFFLRNSLCVSAGIFGAFVLLAVPISIARSVLEDDSIKQEEKESTQSVISSLEVTNQNSLLKF